MFILEYSKYKNTKYNDYHALLLIINIYYYQTFNIIAIYTTINFQHYPFHFKTCFLPSQIPPTKFPTVKLQYPSSRKYHANYPHRKSISVAASMGGAGFSSFGSSSASSSPLSFVFSNPSSTTIPFPQDEKGTRSSFYETKLRSHYST